MASHTHGGRSSPQAVLQAVRFARQLQQTSGSGQPDPASGGGSIAHASLPVDRSPRATAAALPAAAMSALGTYRPGAGAVRCDVMCACLRHCNGGCWSCAWVASGRDMTGGPQVGYRRGGGGGGGALPAVPPAVPASPMQPPCAHDTLAPASCMSVVTRGACSSSGGGGAARCWRRRSSA